MVRVRFGWATEDGHVGESEVDGGNGVPGLVAVMQALSTATRISMAELEVLLNGAALREENIKDLSAQDMVLVRRKPPTMAQQPPIPLQREPTALELREHVRNNPALLTQLLHQNPVMAEAVLSEDISVLENLLQQQKMERQRRDAEEARRVAALNANPFDAEAQRQIEEAIRQENVMNNYESAIEHNPEAFGRVVMLYIDCTVNGHPLKAFVDSGAQSTIMSAACAQRCGLMRLLDSRFAGIAKGVGTARILGRIHVAALTIGTEVFTSSFTVLENSDMEFLLGLDMLRKHQACINLRESVLEIGSQKAPFLAEKDIPLHLRSEDKDPNDPAHVHVPAPVAGPPAAAAPKAAVPSPAVAVPKQTAAASPAYSEDMVRRLMDLGHTREAVIQALNRFGGNGEMAAAFLFESGMNF